MRVAYLILVHKNPHLLKMAVDALRFPECKFFVHVDKKSNLRDFASTIDDDVHIVEPRVSVYWGEFSVTEATIQLIRSALKNESKFEYLVFLQGSDFPLRSAKYVNAFLERNRGCEFMSLVRIPAPGYPLWKINKLRYPSEAPILRFTSRVLAKFHLANRDYRRYLSGMEPWAGDQGWTLSREACEYILNFVDNNPPYVRFFRNTFTSDEMFFHTILGNSRFQNHMRRNPLYRDWPLSTDHPAELSDTHAVFFESVKNVWIEDQFGAGEALFARKFSDENLGLVERIARMIRSKEDGQGTSV